MTSEEKSRPSRNRGLFVPSVRQRQRQQRLCTPEPSSPHPMFAGICVRAYIMCCPNVSMYCLMIFHQIHKYAQTDKLWMGARA